MSADVGVLERSVALMRFQGASERLAGLQYAAKQSTDAIRDAIRINREQLRPELHHLIDSLADAETWQPLEELLRSTTVEPQQTRTQILGDRLQRKTGEWQSLRTLHRDPGALRLQLKRYYRIISRLSASETDSKQIVLRAIATMVERDYRSPSDQAASFLESEQTDFAAPAFHDEIHKQLSSLPSSHRIIIPTPPGIDFIQNVENLKQIHVPRQFAIKLQRSSNESSRYVKISIDETSGKERMVAIVAHHPVTAIWVDGCNFRFQAESPDRRIVEIGFPQMSSQMDTTTSPDASVLKAIFLQFAGKSTPSKRVKAFSLSSLDYIQGYPDLHLNATIDRVIPELERCMRPSISLLDKSGIDGRGVSSEQDALAVEVF